MNKQLCRGLFWILTDSYDLSDWSLLIFDTPCDASGNIDNEGNVIFNSKKGNSYNHKKLWEDKVINNNKYKPFNRQEYNYYPRGRVEVSNNKATIYLNPHINITEIINDIKKEFGLSFLNISEVNIVADGSNHYQCFLDWD